MSELLTLVEQMQDDECDDDDDDEDEEADGGSGHHHAHDKKAKAKHHEDSEEDEEDRKGKGKGKGKAERESDSEAETAEEEDDDKPVELFPPFEGFGLFPIAAMMNVRTLSPHTHTHTHRPPTFGKLTGTYVLRTQHSTRASPIHKSSSGAIGRRWWWHCVTLPRARS